MKSYRRVRFPFVPGTLLFLFFCFLYFRDPLIENIVPPRLPQENSIVVSESSVLSVVDGDTITVSADGKKETVRLIGIDSPEYGKNDTKGGCFHEEATNRMKELVGGVIVRMQSDPQGDDRDKYGRLLRFVFLPDGRNAGEIMLREGFAREYTYLERSYVFIDDFTNAEKLAKAEHLGIWGEACR